METAVLTRTRTTQIDTVESHIRVFEQNIKQYPTLMRVAKPLDKPTTPILGRDMRDLRLALRNPEKANVILLGDPGSGKTAFVQGFAFDEESDSYLVLQVNVERLAEEKEGNMDANIANGLLNMVEEARDYSFHHDVILVLFIDEFHRIMMLSPSAVEALKPILEKSAHNGFRVIASTTFEEYDEWIAPNRALDQRLLRVNLTELGRDAVMSILASKAKHYNVLEQCDPEVFGEIYDTSKQILLSNSQPRASIDLLMNIIGTVTKKERMIRGKLVREYATPEELNIASKYIVSRPTLNQVVQRSYNIDIDNKVSVKEVTAALHARIYNQSQAIETMVSSMEMAMGGFTEKNRPKASLLFTGSTGVGKTELALVLAETMGVSLERFDMSRYSRPEDAVEFANSLAQAAWAKPNAIILLDEVEKSTKQAMNILLQVLDAARLTAANNPNRVVSFTGNIVLLTTNLGSEVYQNMKKFAKSDMKVNPELIYSTLRDAKQFESAVLGRIDAIVPFAPLPDVAMEKISRRALETYVATAETARRKVTVSPDIIPFIVNDKTSRDSERGGARDAKRNVRNLAIQKLAHYKALERKEVPIALHLIGTPRFKNKHVGDADRASITVSEGYPKEVIQKILDKVSAQAKCTLYDEGIFLLNTKNQNEDINGFYQEVIALVKQGVRHFKTDIDVDQFQLINAEVSNG